MIDMTQVNQQATLSFGSSCWALNPGLGRMEVLLSLRETRTCGVRAPTCALKCFPRKSNQDKS